MAGRRKCPPSTEFDPTPQEANEVFIKIRTNRYGSTQRIIRNAYISAVTTLLGNAPNQEAKDWLQQELDGLKIGNGLMTSEQYERFKEISQ